MKPQVQARYTATKEPKEGALALCDLEGRLPKDDIVESKRASKASKSNRRQHHPPAPGSTRNLPPQRTSQTVAHSTTNPPHTCYPHPSPFHPAIRKSTCFLSQGPLRGHCIVLEDVKATKHCNSAIWWLSHLNHTPCTHRCTGRDSIFRIGLTGKVSHALLS